MPMYLEVILMTMLRVVDNFAGIGKNSKYNQIQYGFEAVQSCQESSSEYWTYDIRVINCILLLQP